MTHPLDRPVWNSLHSRLSHLAIGEGVAMGFERGCEHFIAGADRSFETLAALAQLVPREEDASYVEREEWPIPPGCRLIKAATIMQMVAENGIDGSEAGFDFLELGDPQAPEMLELATLCKPGPFFTRTHALGGFIGVRDDSGRLIAMAGERFKIGRFTEVSAVCTHPDARGRGLARGLMRVVASRIVGRGETPFLHCYRDNEGAVALYESLGFRERTDINYTIFQRA